MGNGARFRTKDGFRLRLEAGRATRYHHSVRILKHFVLALPLLSLCATAQTLTITHATIIDTITGKTTPDRTVVIYGNRIASIARSTKHNPRAGQIIDARAEYLIPGLWDMHTHVYFDGTAADGTD